METLLTKTTKQIISGIFDNLVNELVDEMENCQDMFDENWGKCQRSIHAIQTLMNRLDAPLTRALREREELLGTLKSVLEQMEDRGEGDTVTAHGIRKQLNKITL